MTLKARTLASWSRRRSPGRIEPNLFRELCQEFMREVSKARVERGDPEAQRNELKRADGELDRMIDAILVDILPAKLKNMIERFEARKVELIALIAESKELPPVLHPNMAEIDHRKIATPHK